MMISVYDIVENTVGNGEYADYHYFLLFPKCFQKTFSIGSLKIELCGEEFIYGAVYNFVAC